MLVLSMADQSVELAKKSDQSEMIEDGADERKKEGMNSRAEMANIAPLSGS